MLSVDIILFVCLAYVALLFGIAFVVDRQTGQGQMRWLHSPVIYTLSISIYCTSWTFYGAVGSAARNGLEFITIYLGPTLVFVGWWWLLRKLVRIGKVHRITSIADLISSRYGKSASLAVLVTLIAVIATTPYIALQLQSVTRSYQIIAGDADSTTTSFWIAAGMAAFTILFGTRNLDANERHHGVVAAIAVEAIVKLFALIAVGVFAVWGLGGGFAKIFADVPAEAIRGAGDIFGPRWVTLTFLAATAIICLPRQFQVTVVENVEERHLATASWLFPLYLFGMTLFIMPIALVGLQVMPEGNPDLYVLTLPLSEQRHELALLAFLGGFSSATSMIIVATIAVSTMVSNHIVLPLGLRLFAAGHPVGGDLRNLLLTARRVSIAVILGLGFLYFQISGGSDALAAIGLIAFVGVAQFLPSLIGGIFWRGATRAGALTGLLAGSILWAYTLLLPSFGGDVILNKDVLDFGLFGLSVLRPQALFGLEGLDPLVHAVIWSVGANAMLFVLVSTLTAPDALERLQGALFVNVYRSGRGELKSTAIGSADMEDLFVLAQRILGADPARRLFNDIALTQGTAGGLPFATDAAIVRLERELAGSIGAASAHAMITRITGQQSVGITELIDIAGETQQLIETTRELAVKSDELERTAEQLRDVNARLVALDTQKDAFLSQVSHELRTPMTAIRSFSEILLGDEQITDAEQRRFVTIIHDESLRLTRLLNEILDISRLESGIADLPLDALDAESEINTALDTMVAMTQNKGVAVKTVPASVSLPIRANRDRLRQVLINILSNAVKYNRAAQPEITVHPHRHANNVYIDIADNGGGVTREEATMIFEKFARGNQSDREQGAGLGLPISRAIMRAMDGDVLVEFQPDGSSFFRVKLPADTTERTTELTPAPCQSGRQTTTDVTGT